MDDSDDKYADLVKKGPFFTVKKLFRPFVNFFWLKRKAGIHCTHSKKP